MSSSVQKPEHCLPALSIQRHLFNTKDSVHTLNYLGCSDQRSSYSLMILLFFPLAGIHYLLCTSDQPYQGMDGLYSENPRSILSS